MLSRIMTVLMVSLVLTPTHAQGFQGEQESAHARFVRARAEWDVGNFIEALEELESLLQGEPNPELQKRIALLTGELFSVSELATDGRGVRWSPDGKYLAYESGSGPELSTHVSEAGARGVREVVSVSGGGGVFSPTSGTLAYLKVQETAALREARVRAEAEFGGTDRASRNRLRSEMARLDQENSIVVVRNLSSGQERTFRPEGYRISGLIYGPGNDVHFLGGPVDGAGGAGLPGAPGQSGGGGIYRAEEDGSATPLIEGVSAADPVFAGNGDFLVYGTGRGAFSILELATAEVHDFQGSSPVLSADGGRLAFLTEDASGPTLNVLALGADMEARVVELPYPVSTSSTRACPSCPLQSGLSLSPDGRFAVVQARPREDWELFHVSLNGAADSRPVRQVTREIQHDLYPTVLADGRLLAMKGEGRHRRSHLYDLNTGEKIWLFRNNTVRTVAPEYEWAPSPDGSKLLIVAERDGNTVSPERGVYLMDLNREVTRDELLARVRESLEAERDLRARAERMYEPIAAEVRDVVDQISLTRIFDYEEALFQFGPKHVSREGNGPAIEYIADRLREFGYEPELQWFDARGVQSANVVARIQGTVSPDVVYAVSAHFDSNARSPGADDNTSATVGLLEMARVLADHPMPATIEIALFTGEESGLLGSREYVRRAVASGKKLVGALNNDMVGFAEDHRLDNTIRYSNAGIRDVQHGAAILFSEMVTHDAEYYKSTDAAAYYDAYGDIVGGIGSYPILGSPHYHQSHDVLETINHKLVTETAKMSTASVMLMASVPSRLGSLDVRREGGSIVVSWAPAVEADVKAYKVAHGPAESPLQTVVEVTNPEVRLEDLPDGTVISVKAVNVGGMEGWDWTRTEVER